MDNRTEVLSQLLDKAQFFLNNSKRLDSATIYAVRKLATTMRKSTDPTEVVRIYNNVVELHTLALKTINNILEKFPVEMTIQEMRLLEMFRLAPEKDKSEILRILTTYTAQEEEV